MTQPGKVYVAPLDADPWAVKGWVELGYTTDEGVSTYSEDERIPVPSLAALTEATKAITVSFKGFAKALSIITGLPPGCIFFAPGYRRPAHLRRMRALYRHKRGRRRFR